MGRIASVLYGAKLPFQATRLILTHPKLFFWSLLPIGITFYIYHQFLGGLNGYLTDTLNSWFMKMGWSKEGIFAVLSFLLLKIILILVGVISFSVISSFVASPFNDFLAESAEKYGAPPMPPAPTTPLTTKLRFILLDMIKSLAALLATLMALLFSWIPILNIFAFIIMFLLICFQYVSYPQTRRGIGLRKGATFLWRHFYASIAFGASVSFLFAIPIISFLFIPCAVVGGTLLYARAQDHTQSLF